MGPEDTGDLPGQQGQLARPCHATKAPMRARAHRHSGRGLLGPRWARRAQKTRGSEPRASHRPHPHGLRQRGQVAPPPAPHAHPCALPPARPPSSHFLSPPVAGGHLGAGVSGTPAPQGAAVRPWKSVGWCSDDVGGIPSPNRPRTCSPPPAGSLPPPETFLKHSCNWEARPRRLPSPPSLGGRASPPPLRRGAGPSRDDRGGRRGVWGGKT